MSAESDFTCPKCGYEWTAIPPTKCPRCFDITQDAKDRLQWMERRLSGLGVDVRQSGAHTEMKYYLNLLMEEIAMTRRFLKDDMGAKQ